METTTTPSKEFEKRVREFGIDPKSLTYKFDDKKHTTTIELCHLVSDIPEVYACARIYDTNGWTRNRIVFKRGSREGKVKCIHAAIVTVPRNEVPNEKKLVELAQTTEMNPIKLPPVEHFLALNSYVAGIAEMGIKKLITASYLETQKYGELPFGFNSVMQTQVANAIKKVYPKGVKDIAREIVYYLVENVDRDWLLTRYSLLEEMYNVSEIICTDVKLVETWFGHKPNPQKMTSKIGNDLKLNQLYKKIAALPNISEEWIEFLASEDRYSNVRMVVAARLDISTKIVEKLSRSTNLGIREIIACRPNLPNHIIKNLVHDRSVWVRQQMAMRSDLPEQYLDKLASDDNERIRESIVLKSNLPESVIKKLANDESSKIRSILASNPYLPDSVIRKLANDEKRNVRIKIASRSSLPKRLIKKLANDESVKIRRRIIQTHHLSKRLIKKLSKDVSSDIRWQIASISELPKRIVKKLANDKKPWIQIQIAKRKLLPRRIKTKLAREKIYDVTNTNKLEDSSKRKREKSKLTPNHKTNE